MPLSTADICWITHTSGITFEEDLKTLEAISDGSMSSFVLALVGKRPATMRKMPSNVEVQWIGEPTLEEDKPMVGDLSAEQINHFASLVDQWKPGLSVPSQATMLMKLSQLLLDFGPGFRQAHLWRQPEILRAMMQFHQRHPLGGTVTDTILIANDLLAVLMKIVGVARQMPKAAIYHSVRGPFGGFIGALAAERHGGTLMCSGNLSAQDDASTFWLKVLPHHWHSSLEHSHIYRTAGKHTLALVHHLIDSLAAKVFTPFPTQAGDDRQQTVHPTLITGDPIRPDQSLSPMVIGWLVDSLTVSCLESLGEVSRHLVDLKDKVTIKIIEAAPNKCADIVDMGQWLTLHREAHRIFSGVVRYQKSECEGAHLVVYAPTHGNVRCGEETTWTLLQTLANGTPMVSSKCGGYILLDHTEMVVKSNDPQQIAEVIRNIVSTPDLQATMSSAALDLAKTQFSCAQAANTHEEVYNELLAAGTHRRPMPASSRTPSSFATKA